MDNPNSQDRPSVDQQVMVSPNAADVTPNEIPPAGRFPDGPAPGLMNGVDRPVRGPHDMDGETVSGTVLDDHGAQSTEAAARMNPRTVGDFLEGPGRTAGTSGGLLSGLARVVQAIPAAVESVVPSVAPKATGATGRMVSPSSHDAVEYASVRSSWSADPRPPQPTQLPATPLLTESMVARMRELERAAPLLYPRADPAPYSVQHPPSSASSDIQAEVRRQLSELMAIRDEEGRRLRAQVEALAVENSELRGRLVEDVQGRNQFHHAETVVPGFPGLSWIGALAESFPTHGNDDFGVYPSRGLKSIQDPPAGAALQSNPEVSFRVSLSRASLHVDMNPDEDKVMKLHAQILSELEAINHRGVKDKDADKEKDRAKEAAAQAKVKGVDQALKMIAELETKRLEAFQESVQDLECQIEHLQAEPDPTHLLRKFVETGDRGDLLQALMAQPYLSEVPASVKAWMAEGIGSTDASSGRSLLKALPLRRSARRALLQSDRWFVHLCAGAPKQEDPISEWCAERGLIPLTVDLREKGGKGWDLTRRNGVWRLLLWAAAAGKIACLFSSPPLKADPAKEVLRYQDRVLWSLASVANGKGIPFVSEVSGIKDASVERFVQWSGSELVAFYQGALGALHARPTRIITNLPLNFLQHLPIKGSTDSPREGPVWTVEFRRELVSALNGIPAGATCERLDDMIRAARPSTHEVDRAQKTAELEEERLNCMFEAESVLSSSDEDEESPITEDGCQEEEEIPQVREVKELSRAELERWRSHVMNGHVPYRKDCRQCVEGSGLGPFHSKVKHPRSYALSIDLFGPVPATEAGRDESCVTGKCLMRYGLIGAFRIPKTVLTSPPKANGVDDLFGRPAQEEVVLPDDAKDSLYEPSEPGEDLFPELAVEADPPLPPPKDPPSAFAIEVESLELDPEEPKLDDDALKELVQELSEPTEQVVLRFFLPLRTKAGPEVTEAVQRLILHIGRDYPVRSVHHDPGTEFSTTVLARWLAEKGVRVSHSLPTDKKANGLAERTVGWFKSRMRTLLRGARLPTQWWPLAGRWAAHKHNCDVLQVQGPPSFGQQVLHRIKRPADGAKPLMERWIEARYACPHRSITDGHVLITGAGSLVASKGFKVGLLDPTELEGLSLPILQEEDTASDPVAAHAGDSGVKVKPPEKRVRGKSRVSFVDASQHGEDAEALASQYLLDDDVSNSAFRRIVEALAKSEPSSGDRREGVDEKYVLGAFCHGGQRGATKLCKRRPLTTRFLNHFLRRRAEVSHSQGPTEWSALMIMKATEVQQHKDVRNEWGSRNFLLCVPGEFELHTTEQHCLTDRVVSFDPRIMHSVSRTQDWFLVGYTPLGTSKIDPQVKSFLKQVGFRFETNGELEPRISAVRADFEEEEEPEDEFQEPSSSSQHALLVDVGPESGLEEDEQIDSITPLVGWDFATPGALNAPAPNLEETDLYQFLDDRGVARLYRQLMALGVEVASDLSFLYTEDLVENGIPFEDARRIMQGIHPTGTVRPDNPNLCSLTTGEVQLLDRQHRKLPWIFQNRTLGSHSPAPPLRGIGVRGYENEDRPREEDWIVSEERLRNEERWIGYTQQQSNSSSSSQAFGSSHEPSASSSDPVNPFPREDGIPTGGCQSSLPSLDEVYAFHSMYMQALWDEEEDVLPPGYPLEALYPSQGSPPPQEESSASEGEVSVPVDEHACRMVVSEDSVNPGDGRWLEPQIESQTLGDHSEGPRIGVSTNDPLSVISPNRRLADSGAQVLKVDESFYTKEVEELLAGLTEGLKVVHNVSPEEIRRHMPKWIPATKAEVEALEGMSAIRRLTGDEARCALAQRDVQVLPAKTVFTVKPGADSWYRRKCRVVGCGNFEEKDPSLELYASGVPAKALRTVLVEASFRQFLAFITDIKNAFLLAPLPKEMIGKILLRPPKLLEQMGITQPGEYWEVCKAVYGLRQSPRWWSEFRDAMLRDAKWQGATGVTRLVQSRAESNVWKMLNEEGKVVGFVIIYVDDMMFLTTKAEADLAHEWLRSVWQCTPLEEATEHASVTFLGVEVGIGYDSSGRRGFLLGQKGYIDELLRMYEIIPKHRTPVPRDWVREAPDLEEGFSPETLRRAQRITGELLWLTQRTRVDAAYAVSLMSSWCTKSPEFVVRLGTRLLHYLGSTKELRLSLIPVCGENRVVIYTDASFAPYGSHSVSGILVVFRGRSVSWKAKKQAVVSLSTAESELIAGCEGVVMGQSIEALIVEITDNLNTKLLLVDNLAAIALAEGSGTQRTRHLRVRANFVRDQVENKELEVEHCPGEVQLADLLTKILPGPRHHALSGLVGLCSDLERAQVSQVLGTGDNALTGFSRDNRIKLVLLVLVCQMIESEAADEDAEVEPLSLELSVVALMLMLSVLFVWETGKYCFGRCCRFQGPSVRALRAEDADVNAQMSRRQRRQEAIRRAIEQETEVEGLWRRRGEDVQVDNFTPPVVQVNVGNRWISEPEPPIPRFAEVRRIGDDEQVANVNSNLADVQSFPVPSSIHPGLGDSSTPVDPASSSSHAGHGVPATPIDPAALPSIHSGFGISSYQVDPGASSSAPSGTRSLHREIGTQTDFPPGLTHMQMRDIQMITTSSRTPGAVHLFPECQALRGTSSLNRRMFCRYCLTAAERSGT
ncbi:GIP [Symbiodinium sp. CCMP2592]|nr:GIP [Symbiodinium sp. CCMP2592]